MLIIRHLTAKAHVHVMYAPAAAADVANSAASLSTLACRLAAHMAANIVQAVLSCCCLCVCADERLCLEAAAYVSVMMSSLRDQSS